MIAIRLSSHEVLQETADRLSARFDVPDTYLLRMAVLEVLQNAVQHGNGCVRIAVHDDHFIVRNSVSETTQPTAHIGLAMLEGVRAWQRGREFIAMVMVREVRLRALHLEESEVKAIA